MAYTSLKFFFFIAVVMLLYFRFPWKQHKWVVLLAASYFFYLLVSYRLVAFLLFTTVSTYAGALWIEKISVQAKQAIAMHKGEWDRETKKAVKNQANRKKRWILAAVLIGNFGIMVFLKYYNLFAGSLNGLLGGAGFGICCTVGVLKLQIELFVHSCNFFLLVFQLFGHITVLCFQRCRNSVSLVCRQALYPTIDSFKDYVDNIYRTKKIYNIQNFSNVGKTYVYDVRILDDIIATGTNGSGYVYYEEKFVMKQEKKRNNNAYRRLRRKRRLKYCNRR